MKRVLKPNLPFMVKNFLKSVIQMYSYSITITSFLVVRCLFFLSAICYYYVICPERFQIERWALVNSVFWMPISFFKFLHLPMLSYTEILILKFLLLISLLFLSVGFFTKISGIIVFLLSLYLFGLSGNFGQDEIREHTFMFSLMALCLISLKYPKYNLLSFFKNRKYFNTKQISAGPLLLAQHYFVFTYAAAGWLKIKADGFSYFTQPVIEAIFISTQVDFGIFLSQFSLLCKFLGLLVLVMEITTPILFFFRWLLKFYLPALLLFHICIELTMNLHFYPWIISFLIFVPSIIKQQSLNGIPITQTIKNIFMLAFVILFWIFSVQEVRKDYGHWPFGQMGMYATKEVTNQTYWTWGYLDIIKTNGNRQHIIKYEDEVFWPFDHYRALWALQEIRSYNSENLNKALKYLLKLAKENMRNNSSGDPIGIVYGKRKFHLKDKYSKFPLDEEIWDIYCVGNYNDRCASLHKVIRVK